MKLCGAHAYAYAGLRIRICEQTQTRESTQMRAARNKKSLANVFRPQIRATSQEA